MYSELRLDHLFRSYSFSKPEKCQFVNCSHLIASHRLLLNAHGTMPNFNTDFVIFILYNEHFEIKNIATIFNAFSQRVNCIYDAELHNRGLDWGFNCITNTVIQLIPLIPILTGIFPILSFFSSHVIPAKSFFSCGFTL